MLSAASRRRRATAAAAPRSRAAQPHRGPKCTPCAWLMHLHVLCRSQAERLTSSARSADRHRVTPQCHPERVTRSRCGASFPNLQYDRGLRVGPRRCAPATITRGKHGAGAPKFDPVHVKCRRAATAVVSSTRLYSVNGSEMQEARSCRACIIQMLLRRLPQRRSCLPKKAQLAQLSCKPPRTPALATD